MAAILFFPSVQAILFFPSAVFEGTPSNINKYIMNNLYTKNGAFIRLVTKILQSHLTNSSKRILNKMFNFLALLDIRVFGRL